MTALLEWLQTPMPMSEGEAIVLTIFAGLAPIVGAILGVVVALAVIGMRSR